MELLVNIGDIRLCCRGVPVFSLIPLHTARGEEVSIRDDIDEAMSAKGVIAAQLARDSGIDEGLLSRFFNGKSALSLKSLTAVLDVLGYELTIRKKKN